VLRRLGIGGAAVFAEPTIAEVEEVVCLIQGPDVSGVRCRMSVQQGSDIRPLFVFTGGEFRGSPGPSGAPAR
jgi:hypothetical protein